MQSTAPSSKNSASPAEEMRQIAFYRSEDVPLDEGENGSLPSWLMIELQGEIRFHTLEEEENLNKEDGEDGDVNTKDGGRVGGDGSLPVNGVVFFFLRMLLGESSGLRDGVLALDGRGVEDLQTSLLSFLL